MRPEEHGRESEELDVFRPQRPLPLSPDAAQQLFQEQEPGPAGPADPYARHDGYDGYQGHDGYEVPQGYQEFEGYEEYETTTHTENTRPPYTGSLLPVLFEPAGAVQHTRPVRSRPLGLLVGAAVLTACGLLVIAVVREGPGASGDADASSTAPSTDSAALPALPRIPADTAAPSLTPSPEQEQAGNKAGLDTAASRIPASASASASASDHRAAGAGKSEAGTSGGKTTKKPTAKPSPDVTQWSVRSVNYPDRYWAYRDGLGRLDPVSGSSSSQTRDSATFTVVPGLADSSCFSFKVSDGRYLRHYDFRIRADASDGTRLFREDATFCRHQGAAGADSVSFESYNYPGRYLRHRNFQLRIDPYENSSGYRADISFRIVSPWA